MGTIIQVSHKRGAIVCVAYERPLRAYPLYHGPRINPRFCHPYFPGTVVPYVDSADWRGPGGPRPIAAHAR